MTDYRILKVTKRSGRIKWVLQRQYQYGGEWGSVVERSDYRDLAKTAKGFFAIDVDDYPIIAQKDQTPPKPRKKHLSWLG